MSIHLFTMTHKPFTPPPDPLYVPLQVGRAIASDLGYLGDHTKDSISRLNPNFCELTGMYWLWKNYPREDYIGICHYRRYLINEEGKLFSEKELTDLLSHYDMITTKLLTLPGTYKAGFCAHHHEKDLLLTERILKEKYPEYHPIFCQLVNGSHTYFGNIFITKRETYDEYCSWLFDLLFAIQKETDFTGYNHYQRRLFGFLSEFLQTVWIRYHQLSTFPCMVGMSGEKYETTRLKEELALLFQNKDYAKAKACFLKHYERRPDLLMEASDINGELRLCMQIISTCEFENEAYGHCILDSLSEYAGLIHYFSALNQAVNHFLHHQLMKEDILFLKGNSLLTPMALRVSLTLYCEDPLYYEKLLQKRIKRIEEGKGD